VSAKYAFIRSEEGNYPVASMCRWARVSRSGYHDWRRRGPSATARRRAELAELVRFSFDRSEETYGYRRVHAELLRWGYAVHAETVRSIMRELELLPCQPRPWRPVTTVAGDASGVPDLVKRDFTAQAPATKLVGDITYIRTWEGWLYLATVLDCYSKKIVGYAMADHMRTELVTAALDMAGRNGYIRRKVTIFHSDRGTQYMSDDFAKHARKLGFLRSVGRTGVCWDNAWAESVNGTLKNELVHRKVYATREQARFDITRWIELKYNHNRLHSALGYRTPNEVEKAWHVAQIAA
jgi:putative transposase